MYAGSGAPVPRARVKGLVLYCRVGEVGVRGWYDVTGFVNWGRVMFCDSVRVGELSVRYICTS